MKNQYLEQIVAKMKEMGFTVYDDSNILSTAYVPISAEHEEVKSLLNLPEENLKKLAEFDISGCKDFSSTYQAWGRAGLLRFKPYLIDGKENPTLCIRHNRFMHMFRGYYYQISGTPDGIGDCGHGAFRTDELIRLLSKRSFVAESHLVFMIMYAAMIDCGFQNDNFRRMFYNKREDADEYFRNSMKFWDASFNYGVSLTEKYISYKEGMLTSDTCPSKLFVVESKNGALCRFWFNEHAVEVEYCSSTDNGIGKSRIVHFDIPGPMDGIDVRKIRWWNSDDEKDLIIDIKDACAFEGGAVERFILLMLLKLVGVHINWVAAYPIKKMGLIRTTRDAGLISVDSLNDVFK